MRKGYLAATVGLISFFVFIITFSSIKAATTHLVISQIQVGGAGTGHTTDEFVELFNQTGSPVNLSSWKLTKKTKTGTESTLVSTMSGTISPNGYFLVGGPTYSGTASAD